MYSRFCSSTERHQLQKKNRLNAIWVFYQIIFGYWDLQDNIIAII